MSIPTFMESSPACCRNRGLKFAGWLWALFNAAIIMMPLAAAPAAPPGDESAFGSKDEAPGEAALIGIFYDLKQTADRKPSNMDLDTYLQTIQDFVDRGWNEEILDKYYQVSTPRYTTQIFVPLMPSSMAPLAFGVDKLVQAGFWLVHYKAQVVPPRDGTYRFVGWADCQIEVAVNQKLVLSSNWFPKPKFKLECPVASAPAVEGGHCLQSGEWIDLKASTPVDLDVLWGDNGGACAAFLFVQQKGVEYPMENGFPLLPAFQVAPHDIPNLPAEVAFKASPHADVWKALQ